MNRFLEMEIFATVADAGSVSGAAERLNMAKSAVSKRLSDLEARLGVSLMTRSTRRLSLTDEGVEFYEHCISIFAAVNNAEEGVAEANAELSGPMYCGTTVLRSAAFISPSHRVHAAPSGC